MLSDLDKRIAEKLKPKKRKYKIASLDIDKESNNVFDKLPSYEEEEVPEKIYENIRAITAIATQIALENVTVSHYALRIVSRIVDSLTDMKEKRDIIIKVFNKLCNQPNSDYNQLWLQNITYTQDKKSKKSPYSMRLCKLVMGNSEEPLWNNDWLKSNLTSELPYDSIVNKETLKKVTPVIVFRETRAYLEEIY